MLNVNYFCLLYLQPINFCLETVLLEEYHFGITFMNTQLYGEDFIFIELNLLFLPQIGKFDCSSAPAVCSDLYVFQPCLAVFKGQGTKEYEIHHGKREKMKKFIFIFK